MSASNWAVCPRCLGRAVEAREQALEAARVAYGTVTPEEYAAMRDAASPPADPDAFQTFREDYEIHGAASGTVKVDYSGHCSQCHLSVDFKHEQTFYPESR